MVDFQQISMVAFGIILMINIGLISVDASETLDRKIFTNPGDVNGISSYFSYEDLNSTFEAVRPDTSTGITCGWGDIFCGGYKALSQAASDFSYWLGFLTNLIVFFLKYIGAILFGYHFVLMMIAGLMEESITGPIHILLTGISGVIFIIVAYGLWGMVKSIASIVPGVGG